MIASILGSVSLQAEPATECEELSGTPPGLYVTTDEGSTYLIKGDEMLEMKPGQSGYAGASKLACIKSTPKFLDWPCSSDAAQSRKFKTYSVDDLAAQGFEQTRLTREIVRRYFDIPEVIEPVPNWKEGESHTLLDYKDIIQYASAEYWYKPNADRELLDPKRPKVLQISLYVGTHTVVVDGHMADALHRHYGDEKIPVVFVFNDSNSVPISYFGPNTSLEELLKAFNDRGIKVADVPMWELGDFMLAPTADEFEKFFELPTLDEIDPLRKEALGAELETYGFTRKPVFVTMLEGSEKMYVDDPDRLRVAISMKLNKIPTVVIFVEQDTYLRRCGPGTPVGASGEGSISGETTPPGGAIVPPGSGITPPPPEPEASNS